MNLKKSYFKTLKSDNHLPPVNRTLEIDHNRVMGRKKVYRDVWFFHSWVFFFYSILRWSVAVSIMSRQSSRIAAFLQADARLMFCWPRSASTARSQVWLGLPNGRFQSGSSPQITAATAMVVLLW